MSPVKLSGWRFGLVVAGFVGALGLTIFPIIIRPMIDPSPWKESQKQSRRGIVQEEIQPGGMKVWSDPFARKKEEK